MFLIPGCFVMRFALALSSPYIGPSSKRSLGVRTVPHNTSIQFIWLFKLYQRLLTNKFGVIFYKSQYRGLQSDRLFEFDCNTLIFDLKTKTKIKQQKKLLEIELAQIFLLYIESRKSGFCIITNSIIVSFGRPWSLKHIGEMSKKKTGTSKSPSNFYSHLL